jgi:hypothetical protein
MKDYLEIAHRALGGGAVGRGDNDARDNPVFRYGGAPESASADCVPRPPSRFAASRLSCLVRCSLLGEDVVFAGDAATVPSNWAGLVVYRGAELLMFLDANPDHVAAIHRAKKLFDSAVTGYARNDEGGNAR